MIALAVSVIIVTAFIGNNQRVSGKEIMKNMMMDFYEEVCTVRFRKTTENTGIVVFEDRILTERELEHFFYCFEESEYKEIGFSPFSIETDIRYYLIFTDKLGRERIRMKFYGTDTLILDCMDGKTEPKHKRYLIEKTDLESFFEGEGR